MPVTDEGLAEISYETLCAAEASQPAAVEGPQPAAEMDVVESALDDTAVDPAKDSIPLEPEPAVAVARAPEPEPAAAGAEPEQSSEPVKDIYLCLLN